MSAVLVLGLAGCSASAAEPTEAQMKEAMEYAINHPPGIKVSDPGKITFFKKEACDEPTKQGYNCTFDGVGLGAPGADSDRGLIACLTLSVDIDIVAAGGDRKGRLPPPRLRRICRCSGLALQPRPR